jgi:RNA polymerase-binding protein DksA
VKAAPVVPVEKWSKSELAEIRKDLTAQADELRQEIDDAMTALTNLQRGGDGEGAGDDQADAGTKTFEREHEMSLANNSRDLLAQVERGLERLEAGTYGACENCGNGIPKARLKARPAATLCVTCKQREERR